MSQGMDGHANHPPVTFRKCEPEGEQPTPRENRECDPMSTTLSGGLHFFFLRPRDGVALPGRGGRSFTRYQFGGVPSWDSPLGEG